jgi:uncharacterized delta-60 repeat protein
MAPHRFLSALLIFVFGALFLSVQQINAQSGVDPTYNGVPSLSVFPTSGSPVLRQAVQADGKILVWGGALAIEGIAKGRLARLNADGTLDSSFTYCHCGLDYLYNAAPLPDGKILAAGSTNNIQKVIRLNNDGSLDGTFNFVPSVTGSYSWATIAAVQPDGRFFTTRSWSQIGYSGTDVYHFNADGSADASFTSISVGYGSPNYSSLGAIKVLPDGRVYVAVNTNAFGGSYTSLKRYTATGATDPTWETPSFSPSSYVQIYGIDTQADGGLLVVGNFDVVNGISKTDFVRLMPAGNVDLAFTPPTVFQGADVRALTNGKILYSFVPAIGDGVRMMRLNSDGTQDNTYAMEAGLTIRNPWVIDADDRVIFLGSPNLTRLLVDGARDTSFNPVIGHYGRVHTMARQADGKVIVAGEFTGFNGVSTIPMVRTNSDGTLDPSYNTGTGFNAIPTRMVVQPDGKLLVIGLFTSYNGTNVPGIVRLMSDGTIDPSFSITLNAGSSILWFEVQSSGQIYIAGDFSTVNGTSRAGVARIDAAGTLDTGFNALIGGSPYISAVAVQPDGKVLIGGSFSGVGGFNRSNFVRVDSTGALDQSFNPSGGSAERIVLTPSGKILTASAYGGTILRRNLNGTTDSSFATGSFQLTSTSSSYTRIDSILANADGSVIVGGNFDMVGTTSRTGIVRLAPNGSLDGFFLPKGADGQVRTVIEACADKVLIGGDFTRVQTTTKAGIARLNIAAYHGVSPFDFDGDGVADVAVYRPSSGVWYQLFSSGIPYGSPTFGLAGDIPVPADFDGDGKTDLAIFRPSNGDWWYKASSDGTLRTYHLGAAGDIPLPSDVDGDGRADFVVFRPSTNIWYRTTQTGAFSSKEFGLAGDKPVAGDFDGDGKFDRAIFRPSTGDWWYTASSANDAFRAQHWGQNGDVPAPADFDGDGKTDFAVFRPSEGGWYIYNSSNGTYVTAAFGVNGDRPIPADYDGDGKADIAVFRPSTGIWYLWRSTAGTAGIQWGLSTDVAIPNAFVP